MVRPELLNYLKLLGEGGGIKMTLYYLFSTEIRFLNTDVFPCTITVQGTCTQA